MKLFENKDFSILPIGSRSYDFEEILTKLSKSKRELQELYGVEDIPQIKVNIFYSKTDYSRYRTERGDKDIPKYSLSDHKGEEIDICTSTTSTSVLITKIIHQLAHYMYGKSNNPKRRWIDEGIAQNVSGEFSLFDYEKYYNRFRSWYLYQIANIVHQIPHIETLEKTGEQFANEIYNGFDLSYLIIKYLKTMYTKEELKEILKDESRIEKISKYVLIDAINYYNKVFNISQIKTQLKDVTSVEELMDYLDLNIAYGWLDEEGYIHINTMKDIHDKYRVSTPEEAMEKHVGSCVEQASIIAEYCKQHGLEYKMFCSIKPNNNNVHFFCMVSNGEEWIHLEHASEPRKGITKTNDLNGYLEELKGEDLIEEVSQITPGLTLDELVNSIFNKENDKAMK